MGVRKYTTPKSDENKSKLREKLDKSKLRERTQKEGLSQDQQIEIADGFIESSFENQTKILHNSLDKILVAHRNTRLFLFMLTGPFFVVFTTVKYIIKGGVFFYLYKKGKDAKEKEKEKN